MATDQEIEATLKLSKELEAKAEKLFREANDSSKSLEPLFDIADREFARLGPVLNATNAPAGTGISCVDATMELISDWAEFEVATMEGLYAAAGNTAVAGQPAKASPARPAAPRRGMRI